MNYNIKMAIFLTWHRTFKKKWWVDPGFVASKPLAFMAILNILTLKLQQNMTGPQ